MGLLEEKNHKITKNNDNGTHEYDTTVFMRFKNLNVQKTFINWRSTLNSENEEKNECIFKNFFLPCVFLLLQVITAYLTICQDLFCILSNSIIFVIHIMLNLLYISIVCLKNKFSFTPKTLDNFRIIHSVLSFLLFTFHFIIISILNDFSNLQWLSLSTSMLQHAIISFNLISSDRVMYIFKFILFFLFNMFLICQHVWSYFRLSSLLGEFASFNQSITTHSSQQTTYSITDERDCSGHTILFLRPLFMIFNNIETCINVIVVFVLLILFPKKFLQREQENFKLVDQANKIEVEIEKRKEKEKWLLGCIFPYHVIDVVANNGTYCKSSQDAGIIFAKVLSVSVAVIKAIYDNYMCI